MMFRVSLLLSLSFIFFFSCSSKQPQSKLTIQQDGDLFSYIDTSGTTIQSRFSPPNTYNRLPLDSTSFGFYLRNLPLKSHHSPVLLFNGTLKQNQLVHAAVIDLSVGNKNLQQCADAVMRLRGEYQFHQRKFSEIQFHFVSGFLCDFTNWMNGNRVKFNGNKASWVNSADIDNTHANFLKYMQLVFNYASTISLEKELQPVDQVSQVEIGDVLIRAGSPGHAVIIVDMVENENHQKLVLLAQSYMPAQSIHILNNPSNSAISPWYNLDEMEKIFTPEWTFEKNQLKRF